LRTARTAEVGARPDFDLDLHMRRVTAPSPGTVETVLEMATIGAAPAATCR